MWKVHLLLADKAETDVDMDLNVDVEMEHKHGSWTLGSSGAKHGIRDEYGRVVAGKIWVSTTSQVVLRTSSAHWCPPSLSRDRAPRRSRVLVGDAGTAA